MDLVVEDRGESSASSSSSQNLGLDISGGPHTPMGVVNNMGEGPVTPTTPMSVPPSTSQQNNPLGSSDFHHVATTPPTLDRHILQEYKSSNERVRVL